MLLGRACPVPWGCPGPSVLLSGCPADPNTSGSGLGAALHTGAAEPGLGGLQDSPCPSVCAPQVSCSSASISSRICRISWYLCHASVQAASPWLLCILRT